MRIGVIFPQTEIGSDMGAIRAYAQAASDLGYRHLLAYDHVLGADPTHRPGWSGYTMDEQFHEPFVLFGFLAAAVPGLELVSGVIILPQRQTALVAKQAAQVDLCAGGRFRLGVGVGWNPVEYEALGEDFGTRGRRIEEQISVMRALWTDPIVSIEGTYHRIVEAGLNPLPVQRPIPVWMGGDSEIVMARTGRIADGWFPHGRPDEEGVLAGRIARVHAAAVEAGRPPEAVGIEGRLSVSEVPEAEWPAELARWRALGVSHLGLNSMGVGLATVDDHIATLRRFAAVMGSAAPALQGDGR